VCEVARAFRLPVIYDVVGEPYRIELLATEYPDVALIVPHLGSLLTTGGRTRRSSTS